ncbi:MAG: helix-turn-helix domain-containing protein, partial [Pirellulales bacterium]|nr:helix-turn-helix domain-containing protein [Pirellulales bacterium]
MMSFILQPWQLCLVILAGWINREQQQVIDYLHTENQVLKELLGKNRILLNNDQRRRLAVKGKILGRKLLEQVGTLFTPDTILRWHRMLVAKKWDYTERCKSAWRPSVTQEIVELVLRFARENPAWGYGRIQGAWANLGHKISHQTVGNILKEHGIEPAPDRKSQTTWKTFLKSPLGHPQRHRLHPKHQRGSPFATDLLRRTHAPHRRARLPAARKRTPEPYPCRGRGTGGGAAGQAIW